MLKLLAETSLHPTLAAILTVLALLAARDANGQAGDQSPSELIRSLSEEPERRPFMAGCGQTNNAQRGTARELVQLGRAAVANLDQAFDSIEKKGSKSSLFLNAEWLFLAYARILGPAAAPRLERMTKNAKLASHRRNLDYAFALSFHLTSYVSGHSERAASSFCRRQEPKDALDTLIVSLERNDLPRLESVLGPEARRALDHALQTRSWEAVRQEIWQSRPGVHNAVGYRFDIRGPWSEPEETLGEKEKDYRDTPLTSDSVVLDTQFTNSAGKDCVRYKVDFRRVYDPPGVSIYKIDSANVEDLLHAIAACTSE
jgi:hypothetical protein